MRIAFNPSTVAALIAPPNNKDITFDLRGQNIFARGVKFCGTDTNTWRDIKINNVSIDSNILDLRDGDNTTLTNINGVVTINSTQRPVVDNLTSDSTTSSLSANQGRILAELINGKSDSEHTHDDRYLRLTGGWMSGDINFGDDNKIYWGRNTDSASISFKNDGDGDTDSYMSFVTSDNGNEYFRWSHSSGSTNTEWMSLRSDGLRVGGTKVSLEGHSHNDLYYTKTEVNNKLNGKSDTGHTHDDRYLKLTGGTMSGTINRRSGGSTISGRDHAIIRQTYAPGGSSWNPIACVDTETGTWTLGHLSSGDSDTNFHFCFSTNTDYNAGNNNGNYVTLRNKVGTIALLSEIPDKNSWNYDDRYLKLTGGTMNGNARIGHGSGHLYIGNPGNDGWLAVQDICSQDSIGDGKWSIKVDGTASFQRIKFSSNRLIAQVSSGSNSPLKGIKLPYLENNGIGIFSRVGNSTDEGGIVLSEDTCVIYNSFDTGWGLSVRDKDINQTDISGDNTIAFGVRQDYRAYSLGGFEKSGSDNSYVLLGGGGHQTISSLSVNYAASAGYANGIASKGLLDSQEKIDNFITGNRFEYAIFKTAESNNVGFESNDGMILSIPWESTRYGAQIAFDDAISATVKVRSKSTSWGNWHTLLHSGNYNSYSPTLTGTGASGTWNINITGNADTIDNIHSTGFLRWKGMQNIGSNAPFQAVVDIIKDTSKLNDGGLAFYSYADDEYTVLIGSRNDAIRHGNALKWGYANKYLWMIRMINGSPRSSDWEKISAGYADSSGNTDLLDGYHASGLLTALSNSDNGISITVGGTTKSVSNISVNYANSANTSNRTKFLETFRQGSTTDTYGTSYLIWAQWADSTNVRLKCTNYTVWTDKADYASSAGNTDTAQYLRSLGNQNCQTGRTQNYGDVYTYNTYDGNTGSPTTYTSVIGFGRGIAGTVEIAGGWCNTNLYWRSLRDCCEDWHSWRTVLDSNNYTEFINNYYWANVKISASSSTTTSPTVHTLTATRVCAGHNPEIDNSISCSNWFRSSGDTGWYNTTYKGGWYMSDTSWIRAHNGVGIYTSGQIYSSSSIRMGNILLEHTDEINSASGIHLNYRNSGNVSLCQGGGKVGIGTTSPAYKLDVNGQMRADGFHHGSVNSDNYILLAGGGYTSYGGDSSHPIFLGYLNLEHGNDGTISSSFYCLGYSVSFTYTRGGNYCKIYIPDTSYQTFYIRAATASVNYSGGGMDTWTGYRRGDGAWWLHCYAYSSNEVRVKGFRLANDTNDSWWGGNPLWSSNGGANRITVCIFGYVTFK